MIYSNRVTNVVSGAAVQSAATFYFEMQNFKHFGLQNTWTATGAADGSVKVAGGSNGQAGNFQTFPSGTMTFTSLAGDSYLSMANCPWEYVRVTVVPGSSNSGVLQTRVTRKN